MSLEVASTQASNHGQQNKWKTRARSLVDDAPSDGISARGFFVCERSAGAAA